MTNVNTRQPTPYTVGYEMPPKPAPIRYEESAEAAGKSGPQADSASPRSPMTPEQRGPFSSHNGLVNPNSTQASEPGQLAEATKKNQELRAKIEALAAQFLPLIERLNQRVAELTQQLNESAKTTQTPVVTTSPQPEQPIAEAKSVVSEQPQTPPVQESPVAEPPQPSGPDAQVGSTNDFFEKIKVLFGQLQTLIAELVQKIEYLAQRINNPNTPQTPTSVESAGTPETAESDSVQPSTLGDKPSEATSQTTEPTTTQTRTLEQLQLENEHLQTGLTQASTHFQKVISTLEQQVESLARQLEKQAN